ncbi:MBL fold metallo-hydrolase [bacterium]|nr:MBL fold metallo-hydrolase [candidate division CSSED10-310 bacterium]
MVIGTLIVGPLQVNCYFVGCSKTREVFIIDPGDHPEEIRRFLSERNLIPQAILNTHGHIDHVGAVAELKTSLKIPYYLHEADTMFLTSLPEQSKELGLYISGIPEPDGFLENDQLLSVGMESFRVLHTPGHTPGGICFLWENALFTGDTLFAGSVGRCDLPGGDFAILRQSINSQLLHLPGNTKIYPGHGPVSTIEKEKKYNPFLII